MSEMNKCKQYHRILLWYGETMDIKLIVILFTILVPVTIVAALIFLNKKGINIYNPNTQLKVCFAVTLPYLIVLAICMDIPLIGKIAVTIMGCLAGILSFLLSIKADKFLNK
jgi:hypothetical protein